MSLASYRTEIQKHLAEIRKEFPDLTETRENSLTLFYLREILGLDDDDVRSSFTGAARDLGLDAIWINEDFVNLIQTKMTSFSENLKPAVSVLDRELGKLRKTVTALRNKDTKLIRAKGNEYVVRLMPSVFEALRDEVELKVHVVLWGYAADSKEVKNAQQEWQSSQNVTLSILDTTTLCTEYEERQKEIPKEKIEVSVTIESGFFERRIDATARGFSSSAPKKKTKLRRIVTTLSAAQVKKIVRECGESVFDGNVRKYLGDKNDVNRGIIETMEDQDKRSLFECLNNGIQVVCSKVVGSVEKNSTITLMGAQIVNGGQTSRAFARANISDKELGQVWVDVTIIEVDDDELAQEIAKKRNFQTAIKGWDLRSNEKIQREVEERFRDLGFEYQRKSQKAIKRMVAPSRLIDRQDLAQAILSFHLGKPYEARNKARNIPKSGPNGWYDEIFPNSSIDVEKAKEYLVLSLYVKRISEKVKEMRKTYRDKEWYQLLTYCKLHVLGLFGEIVRTKYNATPPLERDQGRAHRDIPKIFFTHEYASLTMDPPNYGLFDVMWDYALDSIQWLAADKSTARDARIVSIDGKYYEDMVKDVKVRINGPRDSEKFRKTKWP